MIKKTNLLFNTVKHLKPIQVFYQLKYRLKNPGTLNDYDKSYLIDKMSVLSFAKQPPVYLSYLGKNKFTFLNQEVQFDSEIDWNYQENGKLWNYNFQYANWLLQEDVSFEEKSELLGSLYEWLDNGKLTVEPYPTSLRAINVMRLFSHENKQDELILANTHAELDFLSKRPEYHLLGNHLLENAYALIMGGAFFSIKKWAEQGQSILEKELEEQILSDGAHFELSPMYHQIIFFRLLELIDWYSEWSLKETAFEQYLRDKASMMLSWLRNISFENGDIPHFNDSAEGIAYSSYWLYDYADKVGISLIEVSLNRSGYRSVKTDNYECKIDFAELGPSYQPGHAHADALSFIMYHKGGPLFVEQGTSTYQIGERRTHERSTHSHNTVVVDNRNQSNIWSGFRVAERANVFILEDAFPLYVAEHDGYKSLGVKHKRSFDFQENSIQICDNVIGNNDLKKEFHLHIAPGVDLMKIDNKVTIQGGISISFVGSTDISIEEYEMADGYNQYKVGNKIVVNFVSHLITNIHFEK